MCLCRERQKCKIFGDNAEFKVALLEVEGDHGAGYDQAVHDVPNVSKIGSRVEDEAQVEDLIIANEME